ncbi:MAG: flagellar basal body-associated FliL family protein [Eubacteriales bacterium]|nr:flagellar basal body-associated FliL family protein [Eubacteriales bacterium]
MKKIIPIILILLALGGAAGYYFLFMQQEPVIESFTLDPGEQFVTDIADSRRLLCADIVFKLADSEKEAFYVENNHVIRNAINAILRSKTEEDLKQERIEGHLDEEILERLNSEFDTDEFLKIYFNTFVIQ